MNETARHCPECGRTLAPTEQGLCAACLLRRGLEGLEPADSPTASPLEQPSSHTTPERVGPYRIVRKIGEGGMGVVYLAQQRDELQREVAIKLVKHGVDSQQVLARFDVERQSLALMNHPCIARVFDAGSTDRGEPYFVMEFVQGLPITEYCDVNRLDNRARLQLFVQVCEAVQHAHQKGVIHRDLKPTNILVTDVDGDPVPKVIDFGVAKATVQRRLEWSVYTELGRLIGTPEYMSPEQADTSGMDVDTRTDVYSLGVILYELLSGTTPHDPGSLRAAGLQAMLRLIRETDCPTPSDRLSTMGDDAQAAARNRRTAPDRLRRQLRGELDWIVMRAVEKERGRRFASPGELGADVQRYLADEPVLASPPGAGYRLKKLVRRHRLAVSAAVAGLIVLIAFAAMMTLNARRLQRERDLVRLEAETTRRVSEFMLGIFKIAEPDESRGHAVTARELLNNGARQITTELADEPELQARLMAAMGAAYRELGMLSDAEPLFEEALDLRRSHHPSDDSRVLKSSADLGALLIDLGRYGDAEPLLLDVLEQCRRTLGEEHEHTLTTMALLANLFELLDRGEQDLELREQVLDTRRRVAGEEDPLTLQAMNNLAVSYRVRERFDEAESLYLQTLKLRRRILGSDHPHTLITLHNIGSLYQQIERFDEAETRYLEALELEQRVLGKDHPETLRTQATLGTLYLVQKRLDEAEGFLVEALAGRERVLGPDHHRTVMSREYLAGLYVERGEFDRAEPLYHAVIESQVQTLGSAHRRTNISRHNLAFLYFRDRRYRQAVDLYERVQDYCDRELPPTHGLTRANLEHLYVALRHLGERERMKEVEARILELGAAEKE